MEAGSHPRMHAQVYLLILQRTIKAERVVAPAVESKVGEPEAAKVRNERIIVLARACMHA